MKKVQKVTKLTVEKERSQFLSLLAQNPNYFGNIGTSKTKALKKIVSNTNYEEISCVGYNPFTEEMEATFEIKRPIGYGGNLCSAGTREYVRFYLDFHDGNGFIDQGSVAVNVHDIPNEKDCSGASIFPLSYVAKAKKETSKISVCKSPSLPTLLAILSWQQEPPANSPGWMPVWGSRKECEVQMRPLTLTFPGGFELPKLDVPTFNTSSLSLIDSKKISALDATQPLAKLNLSDEIGLAKKSKVPASRFAYDTVLKMIQYPTSEITLENQKIFQKSKIDLSSLIKDFTLEIPTDKTKANVDYEELTCLGLDYNTESLVATLVLKKKTGFSGDLCSKGSKEYVSFWIDWGGTCEWKYLDTVELEVHDLNMKTSHLCYQVSLPLDASQYRELCTNPKIVRVRSVLSWQTPPSTVDPDKLNFYGNRIDSHIQLRPGVKIVPGDVYPLFNIIGGVDVDHVNSGNGLTTAGAFFAFNGLPVPKDAPFGGTIVLNGPSFVGHKYRIKITNLSDMSFTYATNNFNVVGSSPTPPYAPVTTQSADASGYYTYLPHNQNTLSVLARFVPTTEDRYMVEIEIQGVPGVFGKAILIDNTAPQIDLTVNDGGDCTHYKKGDTITGNYSVFDQHISSWRLRSTWSPAITGTSNTGFPNPSFSIPTSATSYPCGDVSIYAVDKTIVNSQSVGRESYRRYNICLRDK